MVKNIEIETYNSMEVLGTICNVVLEEEIFSFIEDLKIYHEITDDSEQIEFMVKMANKYTTGFWYCWECQCFYSKEDFSENKCPQCFLENA